MFLKRTTVSPYAIDDNLNILAAEEQVEYKTIPQMEKAISQIKRMMEKAAKDMDLMKRQD